MTLTKNVYNSKERNMMQVLKIATPGLGHHIMQRVIL